MPTLDIFRFVQRLHFFINRKATGSPCELARKLGISRASLYRYFDALRGMGAKIGYCKQRQSYYYEEKFELNLERLVF